MAASQFYKMLLKGKYRAPPIENLSEAISSIEYVVHQKTLETFNSKKKDFEEKRRGLNKDGKVKELLLFHGTDTSNVDSIVENNFSIDALPYQRKKKMAFGRGVYMSEHPQIALSYGDTLLLCRVSSYPHTPLYILKKRKTLSKLRLFLFLQVLPGEVERLEMNDGTVQVPNRGHISAGHDSREIQRGLDNVGLIHVIKDEAQILPYCILHLTGGQQENAFNVPGPGPLSASPGQNPNSAVTPTGPMDQQNSQGPSNQQDNRTDST